MIDTIQPGRGLAPVKARRHVADRSGGSGTPLPTDVVAGAARRVRVVALLYAATFLVLGPVAALLSGDGGLFFGSPLRWSPSIVGIVTALAVVAVSVSPRCPPRTILIIGLLFEAAGAYGIAAARYLHRSRQTRRPFRGSPSGSWCSRRSCPARLAARSCRRSGLARPCRSWSLPGFCFATESRRP